MDEIEDITAQLDDLNVEDRVYRVGDQKVKVKTWHDASHSEHGCEIFRASGSFCGHDGKALRRDGRPRVHDFRRHLVVHSDSDVDLAAEIETLRRGVIADTLRAERHYSAVGSIAGLGTTATPPVTIPLDSDTN